MKVYQYTCGKWFNKAQFFFNIDGRVLSARSRQVVTERQYKEDLLIGVFNA